MAADRTALASLIVLLSGMVWGLYWIPVRALEDLGLPGAWGTLAITASAVLILAPVALARRRELREAGPAVLVFVALGGAAFALYSVAFVYGRVAITILLYFLTAVWSTLIARFLLGRPTPPMRLLAIAAGLAGLGVMLSAKGGLPIPRNLGEWMGLAGGVLWSISTTGIHGRSRLSPLTAGFVFAAGGALAAGVLAPGLAPLPGLGDARLALLSLGTGGLWWALSTAALMWAAVRLEPARVGILLMTEVLIGALSAALLAGEGLSAAELAGGGLVLLAGLLELWPVRRPAGRTPRA